MQDSPHTLDIMCLFGAYEQVVFSSQEEGIIKTLLWKQPTHPSGSKLSLFFLNEKSIMINYQCLTEDEVQISQMVQCQRIDISGFNVLWRFVWTQTHQSSIKYWRVGIELTFVDLQEHFIMDWSVLCKLMTLAPLALFGTWTQGSIFSWLTNMGSVFLKSGD